MESVVLVIHLLLALAIVGLVLIQRSEGGGLGIGGGGMGGLGTPQGIGNALTRTTAICAAGFFVTSLILGALSGTHTSASSLLDKLDQTAPAISSPSGETSPAEPEPSVPISK